MAVIGSPPNFPEGNRPLSNSAAAALNAAFGGGSVDELGPAGPRPGAPRGKKPAPKKRRGANLSLLNIRLLPVTIFVAVLMFSVRINDIWRGMTSVNLSTLSLNQSEAQQPPPPGGRKRGQKAPQVASDAAPAASTAPATPTNAATPAPAAGAAPEAPPAGKAAEATPAAVPSTSGGEGEPPTFTQNEIDVLQKLSERREALDARDRDLNLRENMVKAAEGRIDKKIAEMKGLQTSVEAMLKQIDDQDDAKMKNLAKIYEAMKPKDAGKIFDQLDQRTLLGVVPRMKETKAGMIIETMLPERAKDLTDALAHRRGTKAEGQPN